MKIKLTCTIEASGKGSKSALANAKEDLCSLESFLTDTALSWAEEHESDLDDADIVWHCEVLID